MNLEESTVRTSRKIRRIVIECRDDGGPMTPEQWERAEELMVEFTARAFAAEHPEYFPGMNAEKRDNT